MFYNSDLNNLHVASRCIADSDDDHACFVCTCISISQGQAFLSNTGLIFL